MPITLETQDDEGSFTAVAWWPLPEGLHLGRGRAGDGVSKGKKWLRHSQWLAPGVDGGAGGTQAGQARLGLKCPLTNTETTRGQL